MFLSHHVWLIAFLNDLISLLPDTAQAAQVGQRITIDKMSQTKSVVTLSDDTMIGVGESCVTSIASHTRKYLLN